MSLEEFYNQLEKFDWYYEFSDDFSVYNKGFNEHERLKASANVIGAEAQRLFKAFEEFKFSGEPWGTVKKRKPVL